MNKQELEQILDKWFDDFMIDKVVRTDVHSPVAFCTLKDIVFKTILPSVLKSVLDYEAEDWTNEAIKQNAKELYNITL